MKHDSTSPTPGNSHEKKDWVAPVLEVLTTEATESGKAKMNPMEVGGPANYGTPS